MIRIFILVFASLFATSLAQRSSFAGSRPVGRPDLASRFKDPTSPETINSTVVVVSTTPRPREHVHEASTWATNTLNSQRNQSQNLPTQNNDFPRPQRPSFAGSRPVGRPDLASRFKDPTSTETINNRVGVVSTTLRPREHVHEASTWATNALNPQRNQSQNLPTRNNNLPRPQRPSFAGSRPVEYPDMSPRFRETSTQSIRNRVGGVPTTTRSVDDFGNRGYVDRVNTWPEENRPFDVINSQHIRDHLYNQGNQNVQSRGAFEQGSSSQRPSFAGTRPIGRPEVANRFKNVEEAS